MSLPTNPHPRMDLLKNRIVELFSSELDLIDPALRERVHDILDRIATLAAVSTSMLPRKDEMRDLAATYGWVMYECAKNGESFSHLINWAEVFANEVEAMFLSREKIARLCDVDSPIEVLEDTFVSPLSALLNHSCRVRLYSVDFANNRYIGLVSLNMGPDFTGSFEGKKEIPLIEPPYREIRNTMCCVLSADSIANALDDQRERLIREWYQQSLGLGSIVPETYTWHFSATGPLYYSVVRASAPPTPTMWALSIDAGGSLHTIPYNSRCFDNARLIIIDALLRGSVGQVLAAAVVKLIEKREAKTHNVVVEIDLPQSEATNESPKMIDRQDNLDAIVLDMETDLSNSTSKHLIPSSHADKKEAITFELPTLQGAFDCIPGPKPWVFNPTDTTATAVAEIWEQLCQVPGPSSAILFGPTGTGKDEFAKSLHKASRVHSGKYIPISLRHETNSLLKDLKGAGPGHYTGQMGNHPKSKGEILSVFQKAEEGLVVLSDLTTAIKEGKPLSDFLSILWNVVVGDPVQREHDFVEWNNKSIVVATGPEDSIQFLISDNTYKHLLARFFYKVSFPGWMELDIQSRRAIVRWHLLQLACKFNVERVLVEYSVYDWFINDTTGEFTRENMRAIMGRFMTFKRKTDNQLSDVLVVTSDCFNDYSRTTSSSGDKWIELGGQTFENKLTPFEQIILTIARCKNHEEQNCLASLPTKHEFILKQQMADKIGALDTYYLLIAASSIHSKKVSNDKYGIQPSNLHRHFPSGRMDIINEKLREYFSCTAEAFRGPVQKGSDASKGSRFSYLAAHVRQRARFLQATVERIACAYPPFFHIVPLWDPDWKGNYLSPGVSIAPDGE